MSGSTNRDLFSLIPSLGHTHKRYPVNICIDEDRFSLAQYTVVKMVTWYKSQSANYHHKFIFEFQHAKLNNRPMLYCIVIRGILKIKVINVEASDLDRNYGGSHPQHPLATYLLTRLIRPESLEL
jgi:hypothetical protein